MSPISASGVPAVVKLVTAARVSHTAKWLDDESGSAMTSSIARRPFGETAAGRRVDLFTIGDGGLDVSIMTFGAAMQSVHVPGRDGSRANVALGFATLPEYIENTGHYFGATVGRYANRIGGGRFELDGVVHELSRNEGDNCLHGGPGGFDRKVWEVAEASAGRLALLCSSADGDMGFPGELETRVEYRVDGGEIRIDYRASSSAPTVVNLTNHTCWNLAGEGSGSVDGHLVQLVASSYTPVDPNLIPTGEIAPVEGTPLDFRDPIPIGARGCGYDHNFVLDDDRGSLALAARVTDPATARALDVLTTEPGIQLYTGTFLDGTLVGPSGRPYRKGECFALETQHFPDSPNHPSFPSTTLRPGEVFESTTVYRFEVAGR
jgi:aldose 1-epimerase